MNANSQSETKDHSFAPAGTPILAPSILAGNHAMLAESLGIIESAGVSWVHLDIMDGHFVPNLTFGPQTVADLRRRSNLFFDVHLMLSNPHQHAQSFAKAGANLISIHLEPDYPVMETLDAIRSWGCKNGIVINPDTPVEELFPFVEYVDMVLLMTVQPGFGGQSFRQDVLPKIQRIRRMRDQLKLPFRIEIDGGVDLNTCIPAREAGADTFVAGSAFFKASCPAVWVRDFVAKVGFPPASGA
ncbi:MAG: Ribulose-phosphate 3-epimerase [Verrucomicrobia bacterium ADurb.Bin474]|nr:MAG: Ribulose-phosphate 3-epimerase [Verrucomicrobia bacterium ADurb.Bin474]